jgi:hypothetical protein
MNEERTGKCLRQVEQMDDNLFLNMKDNKIMIRA